MTTTDTCSTLRGAVAAYTGVDDVLDRFRDVEHLFAGVVILGAAALTGQLPTESETP